MMEPPPGIAKFTRLLPLSIRKDCGGNGHGLFGQNSTSTDIDKAFEPQGQRNSAFPSDFYKNPFENHVNHSPPPRNSSEQKEIVRVTVTYPSPSVGAMNPHREIALRFTNDENPTFFYHLRVNESDYPVIKSQQGLLVDFFGFPNQLITLLEKCDPNMLSDSDESKSGGGCGPRFIMVLKIGICSVLDIVESNPFKYLCHLSLQINPGSDTEIKKYLADVTGGLKKECGLWQEKYSHLSSSMENELTRLKTMLDEKNDELKQLRDDIHSQASLLSNKHYQDMTLEKEKLLRMQSELASKFESERQEIDRRHSQAIGSLESRISSLETENRDLIQTKFKNETTLQAYSSKVKTLEDDLKLLQKEVTLARKQNEKLDSDYHEKQRMVNSFQNRISVLETDLKEKQNTVQRQLDYINQISEQKKFLEDQATKLVHEVEKIKGVNKSVSSELIKANEIIKKLQDDIRSLHTKTKMQNQITIEQERRIGDQEKHIKQFEQTVSELKSTVSKLEESEGNAKGELAEANEKIENLETTVKSNENMISWLNKQLNEFQGLGNLNKFRQNLAATSVAAPVPSISAALRGRPADVQDSLGFPNNSTAAVNGTLRQGGLFVSNLQNSLPNGTPSWMNIYQSTSTPLDNDLSSRFERVSAANNNYSLGRSRLEKLDPISEKNGDTEKNIDNENKNPNSSNMEGASGGRALSAPASKTTRPPTWAKPRSGKVTLEVNAPGKPNPIWRK